MATEWNERAWSKGTWTPSVWVKAALFVGLLMWAFVLSCTVTLMGQEAPDCPVWSAEVEDGVHTVMELRPVGRVALGVQDADDESLYLVIGGAAYGDVNAMVCLDVDTVNGNPNPGAQVTVSVMGKVICYKHQPDGTVVMENGRVMYPDPVRTEEVTQQVCIPAALQQEGARS